MYFFLSYISFAVHLALALSNFHHYFEEDTFSEIIICAEDFLKNYEYLLSKSSGTNAFSFCHCGNNSFSDEILNIRSSGSEFFQAIKIIFKIENVTILQKYILWVEAMLRENMHLLPNLYIFVWPSVITFPENSEEILTNFFSAFPSVLKFSFASNVVFEVSYSQCYDCKIFEEFWEYYTLGNIIVLNRVDNIYKPLMMRRNTLKGISIKAVAQYDDDFKFELDMEVKNDSVRFIGGTTVSIFNDLMDSLNFTAISVEGKGWITQNPNGTLTGIGQQVISGETDLSISLSAMTLYRAKHLNFIQPVTSDRYHAVFQQPDTQQDVDIIISPFSDTVWTEVAILCVIMMVILFVVVQLRKFLKNDGEMTEKSEALTYIIGTLCQQSWCPRPGINSEAIAIIDFLLGTVFLYSLYSAAVVSSFSVVIVPIQDFQDLLQYNYIPLIRPSIPIYASVIDNEETVEKLLEESKNYYVDESMSVEWVINSNLNHHRSFAHVSYLSTFFSIGRNLNYTDVQLCSISAVPLGNVRYKNAMFVKKHDEFLEIFNLKTISIMQTGLNSRYLHTFLTETYVHCKNYQEKAAYRQLTLQDFKTVHKIIYIGFIITVLMLIVEFILHIRFSIRRKVHVQMFEYCV